MRKVSVMNRSVRLMIFLNNKRIPVIPKLINYVNRILFSCDIPCSVTIKKNTIFAHSGLGVVLHERVVIGENCRIYQGVTIGGRGTKGTPIIGNNVFIGANSTIIGNVKVGDNSTIGANSLVLYDVNPNSTVGGNPAKELKG